MKEISEIKKKTLEAINNTFGQFPSLDMLRVKNDNNDWIKRHIRVDEVNGELKVVSIYGVEVDSQLSNKHSCFALRHKEEGRNFYRLLTTFDFCKITEENGHERNMVWSSAFSVKQIGGYMPRVMFYSLEDFINAYIHLADERFNPNNLIIVDDTPEE